ncbi:hypothetical protein LIPSTDRAFT_67107 [Lipomyces starkeyi NRRL Y-11557]|uniref:Uncharacterized protein n=1 Tax=Lipomyces starkeyi NRRL Y-11557 TaxID=675824 RepID=A0A1E3QEW0_LIPST|nr:hypothetical protein LIPSTDRAFT_67107 [Lipomyces starkeyi NRRL Y-11557]
MAINQIKKCAEVALYRTAILNDEISRLQETGRQRTPGQKEGVEEGDGDTIVLNTSAKNKPRKV